MAMYGEDMPWTRWWLEYNDRNELERRYDAYAQGDWGGGLARWSYAYDDNGNLTQAKREQKVEGNWTETLRLDYTWNVRDEMTGAAKTMNGSYAGKVEYGYSVIQSGARTERVQYDAADGVTSWKRYEVDGLLTYRVDERYDSDENGLDSGDPWRVVEKRTYGPGLIGNLLFKEVLKYPDPTTDLNPDDRIYYYGYDAGGNVILVTEEYCGGTAYKYCFHQDAFGNELHHDWFEGSSWEDAEEAGITEHQTGKELDSFSGLYFFHHRWYDPQVGRFISRTPLLPWEEGAYLYCANDPVNWVDVDGLSVQKPGFWQSLIPIWGSGKTAISDFQEGHYVWGTVNGVLAVSDVFVVKSIVTACGRVIGKTAFKAGSHTWDATRKWLLRNGLVDPWQPMHHWFIPQARWGEYVPDIIKNQPWNLMPMPSAEFHIALHGWGPDAFNVRKRMWYGTPMWIKAWLTSSVGRFTNIFRDSEELCEDDSCK
jgi:RHS repeat-associated protein